jgi:hypothetical protein
LPIVTALRLCHRYGKGHNVSITKIPTELLSTIEDLVYEAIRTSVTDWSETFRHFETRCKALDHTHKGDELWRIAEKRVLNYDFSDRSCSDEPEEDDSEEDEPDDDESDEYDVERAVWREAKRMLTYGSEWRYERCIEERAKWEELIAMSTDGNFQQYNKASDNPDWRYRASAY